MLTQEKPSWFGDFINSTSTAVVGTGLSSLIVGAATKYYKDVSRVSNGQNLCGLEAGGILGGTFYLSNKITTVGLNKILPLFCPNFSPNISAWMIGNTIKGALDGFVAYQLTQIFAAQLNIPSQLPPEDLKIFGLMACVSSIVLNVVDKLNLWNVKIDALEHKVKELEGRAQTASQTIEVLQKNLPKVRSLFASLDLKN